MTEANTERLSLEELEAHSYDELLPYRIEMRWWWRRGRGRAKRPQGACVHQSIAGVVFNRTCYAVPQGAGEPSITPEAQHEQNGGRS
jgi:hypothetical protein